MEFEERYDWLSSLDDGHGDVHGVDKASEEDSSEFEDREPFLGNDSDGDDDEIVKWFRDGKALFVIVSSRY